MTQEELKKILHTIYKNIRCPSCGKRFDFGHIHIKGYLHNLCFLQLECPDHLPLYATISTPLSNQANTLEFAEAGSIDSDYIINAFKCLENHQGQLSDLMKKND